MLGILLIDVLAVIGLILLLVRAGTQPESGIRSSAVTKWRDDEVVITYREKPPHFRDVPADDPVESFTSCGFCKYYQESECVKYGVKGYGVGSVVQTVCDDFITGFGE